MKYYTYEAFNIRGTGKIKKKCVWDNELII